MITINIISKREKGSNYIFKSLTIFFNGKLKKMYLTGKDQNKYFPFLLF